MREGRVVGWLHDVRDAQAHACERGLLADVSGADVFIIAAADNVMTRDSTDLMAEVYPDVPLRRALSGRETLLSIDRAREVLGYEPRFTWSDEIGVPAST